VVVSGIIDPDWDALACAMDSDAGFVVQAGAGTMLDLEPLVDAAGARVRGGDTARAWVGYRYTDADTGGTVAEYHECRAANGVVVRIQHRSLPEVYQQEAVARDALLEGLDMPSAPPSTAAPTSDAACDGYRAWRESTLTRLDTLASLRSTETQGALDVLETRDLLPYRALLRGLVLDVARLRAEQAGQLAPPAAADAQALAVDMFERYRTAAELLSGYYETNMDLLSLQRAQRAQKAAEGVQQDLEDALVAVEAACG
jgi:hypothetical protein